MHNMYSDEDISAYIDGELDHEERAQLLFAEQQDEALAKRISESRILKEKVRLAYMDLHKNKQPGQSTRCSLFTGQYKSLIAAFLLLTGITLLLVPTVKNNDLRHAKQLMNNSPSLEAQSIAGAIGRHDRVVIHVSQYRQSSFGPIIDEIESLLQQNESDTALTIEVVANRQGLKALDAETSVFAHRLDRLANRFETLEVIACAKSLAKLASDGDPVKLMKSILTTPSATQQIARRSSEGWLYIRI